MPSKSVLSQQGNRAISNSGSAAQPTSSIQPSPQAAATAFIDEVEQLITS